MEHLFVRTTLNTEIAYKFWSPASLDNNDWILIVFMKTILYWIMNKKSTLQYEKLVKLLLGF